jgi:hypothetical protein
MASTADNSPPAPNRRNCRFALSTASLSGGVLSFSRTQARDSVAYALDIERDAIAQSKDEPHRISQYFHRFAPGERPCTVKAESHPGWETILFRQPATYTRI